MIHEEAEDIEIEEFDPAIEASGEDTPEGKPCIVSRRKFWRIIDEDWVFFLGKALSVGKTKNRVLYATVSPLLSYIAGSFFHCNLVPLHLGRSTGCEDKGAVSDGFNRLPSS